MDRNIAVEHSGNDWCRHGRPFTGAWIETPSGKSTLSPHRQVAPSRGRGSKQVSIRCSTQCPTGRPFTGAWIETPLWDAGSACFVGVAPSRGRGSKPDAGRRGRDDRPGRPFTGAWIETVVIGPKIARAGGRPFTGAWIETRRDVDADHQCRRSPLHGGVDRNRRDSPTIAALAAVAPSRGRGSKHRD